LDAEVATLRGRHRRAAKTKVAVIAPRDGEPANRCCCAEQLIPGKQIRREKQRSICCQAPTPIPPNPLFRLGEMLDLRGGVEENQSCGGFSAESFDRDRRPARLRRFLNLRSRFSLRPSNAAPPIAA
jgi:hypothetical protein